MQRPRDRHGAQHMAKMQIARAKSVAARKMMKKDQQVLDAHAKLQIASILFPSLSAVTGMTKQDSEIKQIASQVIALKPPMKDDNGRRAQDRAAYVMAYSIDTLQKHSLQVTLIGAPADGPLVLVH